MMKHSQNSLPAFVQEVAVTETGDRMGRRSAFGSTNRRSAILTILKNHFGCRLAADDDRDQADGCILVAIPPGAIKQGIALASAHRARLFHAVGDRVVSKFIGETEKNLRRLLQSVLHEFAVLFLDEADALFGKRAEVKDSHDRYANLEVGYLLGWLDASSGILLLGSNRPHELHSSLQARVDAWMDDCP